MALILMGVLLSGCRSQAPAVDPFFGRTTIPPPPTGAAVGGLTDPYYQTPPVVQMPSAAQTSGAATAGQATTSLNAPPHLSAPRPTSTAPESWTTRNSASGTSAPPASGTGGSFLPASGGGANYRGASLNDRMPRPVDDATPAGPNYSQPIIRTLQPRTDATGSQGIQDLADLPKAP